ncbi:2-polyprenylphenol hydroxylase [Sulfurisphaera ohwakuensis]|uniref:2-polyprenylphenol hydroxylase n=1 Tax=Sulfurisphaera ohwakuensis TaxID=69656 RepID=A0A650CHB7_SULOH|nr:2-polyprenylphenol hydroxylase [Sulfurisphaera ohwakuensis]MBB5252350.1 NAD(P)H-flavin reductase [Sulfurisphaera ohwakuensis]QGR17190.1 2-polyprenylphenol hydroxylase [Sulfurisphaera ohwakuensis]
MIYSEILYSKKISNNLYEIATFFPQKPQPGQFVSLIIAGEKEIPLSITDYYEGILFLHVSPKIYDLIRDRKKILIKGPLGRPLKLTVSSILGIAYKDLLYDILYILREAKRKGINVKVRCIECNTKEFPKADDEKADLIIASVPKDMISSLPKEALVYVRWVKMNCMLGVCGVCEIKENLACIDGPLIKVSKIVD